MPESILTLRRFFVLALSVIVLRLVYLQLMRGETYYRMSENNRLRLVP